MLVSIAYQNFGPNTRVYTCLCLINFLLSYRIYDISCVLFITQNKHLHFTNKLLLYNNNYFLLL